MNESYRNFLTGLSSYFGEFLSAIINGFKAGYNKKD